MIFAYQKNFSVSRGETGGGGEDFLGLRVGSGGGGEKFFGTLVSRGGRLKLLYRSARPAGFDSTS